MTRRILILTLFVTFSSAWGADVTYFDRATGKTRTERNVDLVEELQGITIKRGGKAVAKVSALDVRDVNYSPEEVKPVPYGDYNQPSGRMRRATVASVTQAEKKQLYKDAHREFTELLPKVP